MPIPTYTHRCFSPTRVAAVCAVVAVLTWSTPAMGIDATPADWRETFFIETNLFLPEIPGHGKPEGGPDSPPVAVAEQFLFVEENIFMPAYAGSPPIVLQDDVS